MQSWSQQAQKKLKSDQIPCPMPFSVPCRLLKKLRLQSVNNFALFLKSKINKSLLDCFQSNLFRYFKAYWCFIYTNVKLIKNIYIKGNYSNFWWNNYWYIFFKTLLQEQICPSYNIFIIMIIGTQHR